jgi:hypothetical protein
MRMTALRRGPTIPQNASITLKSQNRTSLRRLNHATPKAVKEATQEEIDIESDFEVFSDLDDDFEVFSDIDSDVEDNEGFIDEDALVLQIENERLEDQVDDNDAESQRRGKSTDKHPCSKMPRPTAPS